MTSEDKTPAISKTDPDLRVLAVSTIDAYETRVRTISGMMREAYELIQSYQKDVEEGLSVLRNNMAKGQSLRRADFDRIISDITGARARRQQQVSEHLDAFASEEQEMIARLRSIVARGKASDLTNLRKIQEDILTHQKCRERQMIGMLRNFEAQEHELRTSLRPLLDRGQKATVGRLRDVVKTLSTRWETEQSEIFDAFERLEEARSRVRSRWQQVANASA